jgi:S-adenosylmethionine hydrolase
MRKPLITLTTDFGQTDHFAGAMKGVIKTICPAAELIDITHDLTPFAIEEAAFTIGQSWRWFPKGTIHLAVVDPGVGSARRPILVQTAGHSFIGPDNGIFTDPLNSPGAKARVLTQRKYMLPQSSNTFHGRDLFAPCAAHLAAGVKASAFGALIKDALRLRMESPQQTSKRQWSGVVSKVDRFGNCITNFRIAEFPWIATNPFVFAIGFEQVSRFAQHYAECEYGEWYAITGSSGFVEIVLREANAAKKLGIVSGAPVELTGWAREDA